MWNVAKTILKEQNGNTFQSIIKFGFGNGIAISQNVCDRSSRIDDVLNEGYNPLITGGDGAMESDSNFIVSWEQPAFNSP
jgi:hypothetical protein